MEHYIKQLIEDLEEAAANPPAKPFVEPPPHLDDEPEISELALVPFKSIEEWTGIKQEVFPVMTDLRGDQCERVNQAIFKVFHSLHIDLVDAPPGIPPEFLYEVLTSNWDQPVQYLPSSGMDLELCTGNPMTCPYGEFCSCDEEFDEHEIPVRFYEVIPQIAENIDAGLICFLNTKTLEIEEVPEKMYRDPEEFYNLTGASLENEELKHGEWDKCIVFEPLDSHEAFSIMEDFVMDIDDEAFSEKLIYALSHRKPFARFNTIINNSRHREKWFNFKQNRLEDHVKKLIFMEINKWPGDDSEEINGLFNDDGTKIDPESVPVPNLCVICKKHLSGNWEENMLCLLNRHDQQNEDNFQCGAFEKI